MAAYQQDNISRAIRWRAILEVSAIVIVAAQSFQNLAFVFRHSHKVSPTVVVIKKYLLN